MGSCLIQQLFRQTVGVELDPSLVDEVLFPLLRKEKHPTPELLLDIKLTRSSNLDENYVTGVNEVVDRIGIRMDILPFSPNPPPGGYASALSLRSHAWRHGKLTSKFRRSRWDVFAKKNWGSIDIINELREQLDIAHRLRNRYAHTIPAAPLIRCRTEIDQKFVDSYYMWQKDIRDRRVSCGYYGYGRMY